MSAVHRCRLAIERMLYVETADVQLDGKAAVTERLSIRLLQESGEGIPQAAPQHVRVTASLKSLAMRAVSPSML